MVSNKSCNRQSLFLCFFSTDRVNRDCRDGRLVRRLDRIG